MEHPQHDPAPGWLRALGAVVIGLVGATLVYAVVIGAINFGRIGV